MTIRKHLRVFGIVQGVGFRPFINIIADKAGVFGSVCNKGPYVDIFTEGEPEAVAEFERMLKEDAPPRSAILKVEATFEEPKGETEFRIIKSEKVKGDIFVSPDIATCDKCIEELYDPNDKRYLHPFINCTACGPRLTILDSMPYDRVRTSMGVFPMCPDCEYEYTHKETRRYHAQPVCCNDCGPHLSIPYDVWENKEEIIVPAGTKLGRDFREIIRTRQVIKEGGIAAIKGIGGFHLCCDASNEEAVMRLRSLKNRPFKPFALMMKNMDVVKRECVVEEGHEEVLQGPKKPILLLRKRNSKETMAARSVAPDNPNIGVMLPYAPVQMLLFDYPDGQELTDCFVMTSGNPKGAPICRDDSEAVEYLGPLCDIILSNNREIRLRADDTVISWMDGGPYMIRRSRGYAPLPYMMSDDMKGKVLGIGGELKNTFCLATDQLYYMSPYIGDLGDMRSVTALREAVERMEELLEIEPQAVCADLHPLYNSSAFARELGLPVCEIQHHYAHILSCMAENDMRDRVIGVSFDGTGYGTDGTIWGGEFLISDLNGFERAASIAPFSQAGGDLAAREGWRVAVSLLKNSLGDDAAKEYMVSNGICSEGEFNIVNSMIKTGVNTVTSTSMGRVFDAVSAVLGIRRVNSCEGEASMVLQFAAEKYRANTLNEDRGDHESSFDENAGALTRYSDIRKIVTEDEVMSYLGSERYKEEDHEGTGRTVYRMDILAGNLARGRAAGEDVRKLAYIFHRASARMILEGVLDARDRYGLDTVALSGGVMQNTLLMEMTKEYLRNNGFNVIHHHLIPPNDGGIGLGQAYYAMNQINQQGGE